MTLEEFLDRIDGIMCGTSNAERAYLEDLYNEVTKPHLISVEDELPKINPNGSEWEYSDDVIVALKDGSIAVGRYERDNSIGEHYWVLYGVDKDLIVTHWMPAPPRGSSEKPNNCKKFGIKGYENVVIHEGNAKGGILKDAQGDDLPLQETPKKGGKK